MGEGPEVLSLVLVTRQATDFDFDLDMSSLCVEFVSGAHCPLGFARSDAATHARTSSVLS